MPKTQVKLLVALQKQWQNNGDNMSDIEYERYAEQQRENCLEEIFENIATYYDGDTIESIVDNVWDKVVLPFESYTKFVDKDDIKELVTEYADSLR